MFNYCNELNHIRVNEYLFFFLYDCIHRYRLSPQQLYQAQAVKTLPKQAVKTALGLYSYSTLHFSWCTQYFQEKNN